MKIRLQYKNRKVEYIYRDLNVEHPKKILKNFPYFYKNDLETDPDQPFLPIKVLKEFRFVGTEEDDTPIYMETN